MKQIITLLIALIAFTNSFAQLTTLPDGGNKKAWVGERVGITDITIQYNRPHVKGREGKIWGQLVGYGFNDLGFGTSKAAPWRAGANENTNIEFSTDVKIEGKDLPAGRYGFFIAPYPDHCTIIFSKNYTSWGSFFYDSTEDVLRVDVKQVPQDKSTEWLTYDFENQTTNSAVIALTWEKWKIPFTVSVDYNKLQIEAFRRELRSDKGFQWEPWNQAGQFCLDADTDLNEGLHWAETAANLPFIGQANFTTLSTEAGLLNKLGKTMEADSVMKKAMPMANANELFQYGRTLLTQNKTTEAEEAFKLNYDKHPNIFITNVGMAKIYSAKGNYKEALKYAQLALQQAPDEPNKKRLGEIVDTLKTGKDFNK